MEIKKVIIQVTNKTKVEKDPYSITSSFNYECSVRRLPTAGKTETYEFKAKVFNKTKLNKSLVLSALNTGKNYIDNLFELENTYLNDYNIKWVFEKGCFKYSVLSIIDWTD